MHAQPDYMRLHHCACIIGARISQNDNRSYDLAYDIPSLDQIFYTYNTNIILKLFN